MFDTDKTRGPRVALVERGGKSCAAAVSGCTDINYLEYDPVATISDGSNCQTVRNIADLQACVHYLVGVLHCCVCVQEKVLGCLNKNFAEYSPTANRDGPIIAGKFCRFAVSTYLKI